MTTGNMGSRRSFDPKWDEDGETEGSRVCAQNQHVDLSGEELSSVVAEMQLDPEVHGRFELPEYLQV